MLSAACVLNEGVIELGLGLVLTGDLEITDTDVILHEGEEGLRAAGLDVELGQSGEVHPEELVVLPNPAKHDLQTLEVGAGLTQRVQLDRVVHAADLQDLQVGARVAEEEPLEVLRIVLVLEIEVEL